MLQQQDNIFSIAEHVNYFGPATAIEEENSDGDVKIRWSIDGKTMVAIAKITFTRDKLLQSQTKVLVAGNSINEMYVIGSLDVMLPSKSTTHNTIQTTQGAFAELHKTSSTESLAIYSDEKELLFEYDPVNRVSRVNVPQGDLELISQRGNIKFSAGKTVEINGDTLSLNSKKLSIKAIAGQMVFGRLETTAETLIESAKNVYRNVKELSQLRTGRLRTLVDESYQVNADKVLVKSENDFKVKAEKIHLG